MQLTALEKLMYEVMKAIYDSGIPISFKGSMVLKPACLKRDIPKKCAIQWTLMQTGTPILRRLPGR